jgi:uncharacterized protein YqjF (DUF2071 family)
MRYLIRVTEVTIAERLAIRSRPDSWPIMYQSWGSLLFIHWTFSPGELQSLIPDGLEIDTFGGNAYVGITPFTLWNARPIFTPAIPYLSDFHEINVRTYVHRDGVPGVYFFSLDANRLIPVIGARNMFHLPYRLGEISLHRRDNAVDFTLERREEPKAFFNARWVEDPESFQAEPGSLEFFLSERYCLYTQDGHKLLRCRIAHEPWPLRQAKLLSYKTDLFEANGLPVPGQPPITHAGGPVHVEVWPLESVL